MKDWEERLQNKVDSVLYKWMKQNSKTSTTLPECIEILEKNGIYNLTNKPGLPLGNDLRDARKASEIGNSEYFAYSTKHLKFEQKKKHKAWRICLLGNSIEKYAKSRMANIIKIPIAILPWAGGAINEIINCIQAEMLEKRLKDLQTEQTLKKLRMD